MDELEKELSKSSEKVNQSKVNSIKLTLDDGVNVSSFNDLGKYLFRYKDKFFTYFQNRDFWAFLEKLDSKFAYKVRRLYENCKNVDFSVFLFKLRYMINPYFKFIFNNREYENISDIDPISFLAVLPNFDYNLNMYISNKLFTYFLKVRGVDVSSKLYKKYDYLEKLYQLKNKFGYYFFCYSFVKDEAFYYSKRKYTNIDVFFKNVIAYKQVDVLAKRFVLDEPLFLAYFAKNKKSSIMIDVNKLIKMKADYFKESKDTLIKFKRLTGIDKLNTENEDE